VSPSKLLKRKAPLYFVFDVNPNKGEIMSQGASPRALIVTILISAVLITGSLVFMGIQYRQISQPLSDEDFQAKVEKGIVVFIEKQKAAQQGQIDNSQLIAEFLPSVSKTSDHIFGNPDAVVSLIEYSDFECPFCKKFHTTPPEIIAQHKDKVNWVYRHLPLDFHNPGAQKQAEASECANEVGGNDAFWKYTGLIYDRTKSNGNGFPLENLVPLAVEVGLDKNKFEECFNSSKFAERVQKDLNEAMKMGISGTPFIIIKNNLTGKIRFKSGAYPAAVFNTEIDALLN
jgi:protein-disulfide isomerase